MSQYNFAPKIAHKYNIKLIFYGETHSDYGGPLVETSKSLRDKSFHTYSNLSDIFIAGMKFSELKEKYKITEKDLMNFLPMEEVYLRKQTLR